MYFFWLRTRGCDFFGVSLFSVVFLGITLALISLKAKSVFSPFYFYLTRATFFFNRILFYPLNYVYSFALFSYKLSFRFLLCLLFGGTFLFTFSSSFLILCYFIISLFRFIYSWKANSSESMLSAISFGNYTFMPLKTNFNFSSTSIANSLLF